MAITPDQFINAYLDNYKKIHPKFDRNSLTPEDVAREMINALVPVAGLETELVKRTLVLDLQGEIRGTGDELYEAMVGVIKKSWSLMRPSDRRLFPRNYEKFISALQ